MKYIILTKSFNRTAAVISLIIVLLSIVNISFAQHREHQGPPPIPNDGQIKEMIAGLGKELSLTDEQKKKISELYFDHFKEMRKNTKMNKGNIKPNREEHEKLRNDFHNEVKSFLTEKQQKKFDEFVRKQHLKPGPKKAKGLNK